MHIHTTALVDKDSQIGRDVSIGPFSVIGKNCIIGDGTTIASHVVITNTKIGKACKIGTGSVLGGLPQIAGVNEIGSFVKIGNESIIGEFVSIHRAGTARGTTMIGDNNFVMTFTHVAHDCITEKNVILTSYTGLSGHVQIGEGAVIGGQAGIHQFVRIGRYSMIGGMSRIVKDVIPFFLAEGNPAALRGLNRVGLKRNNFSSEAISAIKEAYKTLALRGLNVSQALKILKAAPAQEEVSVIVDFISNSERGVTI